MYLCTVQRSEQNVIPYCAVFFIPRLLSIRSIQWFQHYCIMWRTWSTIVSILSRTFSEKSNVFLTDIVFNPSYTTAEKKLLHQKELSWLLYLLK